MGHTKQYPFPVVRYRNGCPATFFKSKVVYAELHEKALKELSEERAAHAATRKALEGVGLAMKKRLPNVGGWENRCPYCGKETPCGDLVHHDGCPLTLVEAATKEATAQHTTAQETPEQLRALLRRAHEALESHVGSAYCELGVDEQLMADLEAALTPAKQTNKKS